MASFPDFNTCAPSGSDAHWLVPNGTSVVLILSASQEQRAHASVFNDSPASLYLKYGSPAGTGPVGIYDVKLTSGSYYELPKPIFQGEVYGTWDAAGGGFARVLQIGPATPPKGY